MKIPARVQTELFAAANLGFLGVDITIAHASNAFARRVEWAPIVFSAIAVVLLAPTFLWWRRTRVLSILVGAAAITVGVAGMLYHLQSGFFRAQTLRALVYAAPFAAPLAYVGVGLLLLLSRLEEPGTETWASWVVFFAMGGFVGNLALTLADHAQNGFFSPLEWISVGAAAFGVGVLAACLVRPQDRAFGDVAIGVMGLQAVVGLVGVALHWHGILDQEGPSLRYKLVFGPPAFAPMLFADLALLAVIGLVARRDRSLVR